MNSKLQNNKQPNGFTLVELLIFMALFSVVLVILSSLFAATVQQQLETQAISATESDSTYIISRLQYDLDRADAVIEPANPGETSNTLILDIGGQEYTYSVTSERLIMSTLSETYELLSPRSKVTGVSFGQIGNIDGKPTIQVQIVVTSLAKNATGAETATINTVFSIK